MAHMAILGIRGLDIYTLADYAAIGQMIKVQIPERIWEAFKSLGKDAKKGRRQMAVITVRNGWIYVGVVFPNGKIPLTFCSQNGWQAKSTLCIFLYMTVLKILRLALTAPLYKLQLHSPTDLLPANVQGQSGKNCRLYFMERNVTPKAGVLPVPAYPIQLLERALGRETINLGFSGNGHG